MMLCDAHAHLANLSKKMDIEPLLAAAKDAGIKAWLSNALTKEELAVYERLVRLPDFNLRYSAGIHPFWHECDLELEDIASLADGGKIWAIGEIGLDRANKDHAAMRELFIEQLKLAVEYSLPVVLHIVGHQQEAYNILREYPLTYLMHGYAGHVNPMQNFLKLDMFFTISRRVIREDKRDLLKLMLSSGRYLFETDITAEYVDESEDNPLLRLLGLAEECSRISGISLDELISVQAENYEKLTGERL